MKPIVFYLREGTYFMSEQVKASTRSIYVYVTINAEDVMNKYPKNNNLNSPVFIEHTYGYMVVGNARGAEHQGTGDLKFIAKRGDNINFVGSTTSDNFEEIALITKIAHNTGDLVVTNLHTVKYTDYPVPNVEGGTDKQSFFFYKGEITYVGTENYNVYFTLYTRNDENKPELYGYFAWDPQIQVKG